MDTTTSTHKLPIHEHPLLLSARFFIAECGGCHVTETLYGGYFCNEAQCNRWFHKECAEAPLEINHHPYHPEHPLLLTIDSPARGDTPCDSCGQKILPPCYTCPTCEYKVDLICGIKPSPSVIGHPVSHDHPLVFFKKQEEKEVPCEVCNESVGGPFYSCLECNNVYFHLDCVHLSKEVHHPCHSTHPLTIITAESGFDLERYYCALCSSPRSGKHYHCYICNLHVCLGCTKRPPPLVVNHTKTHKHPLRFLLSKITFTCNLCQVEDFDTALYVCLECGLLVHKNCVGLPQVININRHDHRISFTHHLGPEHAFCGVCRIILTQSYGAYSCSICTNYAVHVRCAVDSTVWNGVELEGVPETSEDISPFKVVGDNLIRHFIHGNHNLLLLEDYAMVREYYEWLKCDACVCPIGFGPFYKCQECPFYLHEKCANIPMKKKLVFHPTTYKLEYVGRSLYCFLCRILSSGFVFKLQGLDRKYQYVDVHCGSISEPFNHDGHMHPLYFGRTKGKCCYGCYRVLDDNMLTCDCCNFHLCLYCANLPGKIWHMSDEHPLTLHYKDRITLYYGRVHRKRWCEVCEMELDPDKWFFICSDCRVTLHVQCVMGDFSHLKPNGCITIKRKKYKVVLNNHNTRPFCRQCRNRCKVPHILKEDDEQKNGYICSISCLSSFAGVEFHGLV